ncbi:hypothetical protein [Couchioplanes caeruleus]|uniref:hypothetical protein n=1 Tax=Couchioplanes caeruleus TaxID=56438 RepID=UPI001FCFC27D|nr:hypothetical protein [Couchioplanes caeruleus]
MTVPSLNALLTSAAWRNDHNGFSHQGPGCIRVVVTMETVAAAHRDPGLDVRSWVMTPPLTLLDRIGQSRTW